MPGLNSKMSELSAIVGLENLKNINLILSKRKQVIKRYTEFFKTLENKNFISLMNVKKNIFCNFFFFPIILKNKSSQQFINFMNKKKIYCRTYYKLLGCLT